ncbi:hypothetical protein OKW45_002073 [Paraburkholderia sp. WSM4175]
MASYMLKSALQPVALASGAHSPYVSVSVSRVTVFALMVVDVDTE